MSFCGEISSHIDDLLGGRAVGRVHSVFASSLNVRVDSFLVHVGPTTQPLSAFGCTIDPARCAVLVTDAEAGDQVVWTGKTLRIYTRRAVHALHVDDLRVRDLSLLSALPLREVIGADELSARLAALGEQLASARVGARCGLALDDGELHAHLEALTALAARSGVAAGYDAAVEEGVADACAYLVGRGLGLTPSGDDILVGYGIALLMTGGRDTRFETFFRALNAALELRTTTDVSAAYLNCTLNGFANQDFIELAQIMRNGEVGLLGGAVSSLLDYGHTSGADGLLGLAAGLSLLDYVWAA